MMARGRVLPRAMLVLVFAIAIGAGSPTEVRACTGETPSLEAITSTAWLIAEFEVISVGPEVSIGVPGSFVTRVHRVLKGSAPPVMSFEWPTPVGLCDGYIATLGDRFVMAFGARPFPAGGPYNAMWPILVGHGSAGGRGDLAALLEAAGPIDGQALPGVAESFPWIEIAVALTIGIGAVLLVRRAVRRGLARESPIE